MVYQSSKGMLGLIRTTCPGEDSLGQSAGCLTLRLYLLCACEFFQSRLHVCLGSLLGMQYLFSERLFASEGIRRYHVSGGLKL